MKLSTLKIFHLCSLILHTITAAAYSSQKPLSDPVPIFEKVRGHNNAYFTQIPAHEQLFRVLKLDIYPYPHILHNEIFMYMDGIVRGANSIPLSDLANATIEVSGLCPNYHQESGLLSEVRSLNMEPGRGCDLRPGEGRIPRFTWLRNLLTFHYGMWYCYPGHCERGVWNCSLEVAVRLPDQRIMFSMASNFTLQWPPPEDGDEGNYGLDGYGFSGKAGKQGRGLESNPLKTNRSSWSLFRD